MQRLFSTFPAGLPERGLVLLRIAAAAPLLLATFPLFPHAYGGANAPSRLIETAGGVFLLLGFATPTWWWCSESEDARSA